MIADFESDGYGAWKTEGTAFGEGPAQGTLRNQMQVSGFLGKKLVNSFHGGDSSVGKLTSPEITLEKKYLNFLIGGGGHPGTAFNMLLDGKTVRTANGPNTVSGGSEKLNWNSWDTTDLIGKKVVLEIVDNETGGWGHINIDHIFQSDAKMEYKDVSRDFTIAKRFLHLPVKKGCPQIWMRVELDGKLQHEFEIEFATGDEVDFYATIEVGQWTGKKLTLVAEHVIDVENTLKKIVASDNITDEKNVYGEKYRPQFHFTPRRGWTNDPNGMVYYQGEYHLFFQHNPFSVDWGNMTWGHAVSKDMLHWEELPDAIIPDKLGTIYSGSAVVDWNNTSGFQTGDEKVLVAFYTSAGGHARPSVPFTQSIAYSNDRGRTLTKYEGNPVIPHIEGGNRDPKVFWYEPTKSWIMALYIEREDYMLFGSKNLKQWEKLCDIKNLGCSECPDMFELAVDGDSGNKKWVFWGGNGKYLIGSFDGKTFTKEAGPFDTKYGGNDYAAQTFSDIPDGRRIMISWMQGGEYPGMPFNQQMSIPRVLTLKTTKDGVRLCMEPIKEIETIREKSLGKTAMAISTEYEKTVVSEFGLYDIELEYRLSDEATSQGVKIFGKTVEYDAAKKALNVDGVRAPLSSIDGELKLRILVDRTSIEVFANQGEVQIAKCYVPGDDDKITLFQKSGGVEQGCKVHQLRSTWK